MRFSNMKFKNGEKYSADFTNCRKSRIGVYEFIVVEDGRGGANFQLTDGSGRRISDIEDWHYILKYCDFEKVEEENLSPVYYKIILDSEGTLCVVCLQWFDEFDYDQKRFITDSHGNQREFDNEEDAKKWLNSNIQDKYIRQSDKTTGNLEYMYK